MFSSFRNPPSHYGVMPLWIWNASVTEDEIERQIREMHQKGIGGFIIQSEPDCMKGPVYKRRIDYAQKAAIDLGMHVHTIDEVPILAPRDRAAAPHDAQDSVHFLDRLDHADGHSEAVTLYSSDRSPLHALAVSPSKPGSDSRRSIHKMASSTAHTTGLDRVLLGLFRDCGWSLSLERMKSIVDREAVCGVNLFNPQAFLYSVAGARGASCPASQFHQATYWPHYKLFADYTSRLSFALCQGKHKAQAALFYPIKSFHYEQARHPDSAISAMISEYFDVYHACLPKEHVDFDVLDEDSIKRAMSLDEHLMLQGEEYELLILPPVTAIGYETALKLREFVEDGGKLLATMLLPLRDADGDRHADVAAIFEELFGLDPRELREEIVAGKPPTRPRLSHNAGNLLFYQAANPADLVPGLRGTLSMAIKPEVSVRRGGSECHDIGCIHRTLENSEIYFFANTAADAREVRISIRCDRAPYVVNLETGESAALANCTQQGSRTVLLHRFEKYGSLLVYFTNELALTAIAQALENGYEIVLPDEWDFQAEGDNCITLHDWTLNLVEHNPDSPHEYVTSFEAAIVPDRLLLLLENSAESKSAIFVNDVQATQIDTWRLDVGFKAVEIGALTKTGTNRIKVITSPGAETGGPLSSLRYARLMGAFSLDATRTVLKTPRKTMRTGTWTDQGYPYYSGTASYTQLVDIPEFFSGQRVFVRAENPADMVEFIVNGTHAGIRPWAPFEVDVTALVKAGRNTIELRVTNSLANSLTREARPSGLINGARVVIY